MISCLASLPAAVLLRRTSLYAYVRSSLSPRNTSKSFGHNSFLDNQNGFSLLELLVSITVTGALLLASGTFVIEGIVGGNRELNKTIVQTNAKQAVDSVASVIKYGRTVEASNTLTDPSKPGGWTQIQNGTSATLILAVPSKDANGNLLYIDALHTTLNTDEIIFFLDSSTHRLFKRTLANPVAGNAAKTTCPAASATPSCPADPIIVEDIADLSITYYDADNVALTIPPAAITGTEAVGYTLKQTKTIGAKSYSASYTTIASLRNK